MNRLWLTVLGLLAILALALVFWQNASQRPETLRGNALLLPELTGQVNDIQVIAVTGAGNRTIVTLERDQAHWRVAEQHGFEADLERVRMLLRALAEARLAEPKTARDEWYARLGVEDVAREDAGGLRVAFPDTDIPAVIVGHAAQSPGGSYVRLEGQEQSWLTDRELDVPAAATDWLRSRILDIPAADVASLMIRHADGEVVQLRAHADNPGDFELLDVPENRQPAAQWTVNQPAGALANLRLQEVRPLAGEELPAPATRALYVTGDRLEFVATVFEDEGQRFGGGYWVHFQVSADTPAVLDTEEDFSDADNEARTDAGALDARLSPWLFKIPEAKYNQMTRRLEDLLNAVE